jgi:predicted MPP superfamily phosphohydrolase
MSLFLLTFFLIYGGAHVYSFLRARPALSLTPLSTLLVSLFMVFMVAAPVFVRLAERAGHGGLARVIGYIGYTWMGLLFLYFSASLVVDLYRIVVFLAGKISSGSTGKLSLSPRAAFMLPLLFSFTVGAYGYFEGKSIRVERITVSTDKIPEEIGTIRVVQISDLHLGLLEREKRLIQVMDIVKRESPDLFVATGDLVDGQMYDLEDMADLFNDVQPKYGNFAVMGNHEFYAGASQSVRFIEKAGFRVLRGEAHTNPGDINIVGVDDPAGNYYKENRGRTEPEILSSLPDDRFTLLLKHRPIIDPGSIGLFDLQLSGHTHKGQIFPFKECGVF